MSQKYTSKISAFVLISVLVTISSIYVVNVLNKYFETEPLFDKDIWGTVADWFTYMVTLIGGVFIYITLDSQMKVQRDQTRIFKMEELKYIREIRPEIKFDFSPPLNLTRYNTGDEIIEISLIVSSDRECKYSLKAYTENKVLEEPVIRRMTRIGNSTFYKSFPLKLKVLEYTDGIATIESLTLNLKYSDCDGNEYLYNYGLQTVHDGTDFVDFLVILNDDKLVKQVY